MAKLNELTAPLRACFVHTSLRFKTTGVNTWVPQNLHCITTVCKQALAARLFYPNHGRHPHTPLPLLMGNSSPSGKDNNPAANDFVGRFSENLARAKDALHRAQQRQQKYANQQRRDAEFSVGDEVFLSTRYLNFHLPGGATPKLYPKFTRPLKALFCESFLLWLTSSSYRPQ